MIAHFLRKEVLQWANCFVRNTLVSQIKVTGPRDQVLYSALTKALPLNTTLRRLDLYSGGGYDWAPVFSALGKNTGLKTLKLDGFSTIDALLCTAMTDGLGLNETLEILVFDMSPCTMITPLCGAGCFPFSAPTKLSSP